MKNNKELIIFSGPSGSGKTTIAQHLVNKAFPDDLAFSISATTRKWRGKEQDGVDYYFISNEDFNRRVKSKEFAEWEEVYAGTKYGTLKKEIERIKTEEKIPVLDVDVKGALNLKKVYGSKALIILIAPPSIQELKQRLSGRKTENSEDLMRRLAKAKKELSHREKFDIVLINDNLSTTLEEAEKIVRKNFNIKVTA